MTNKQNVPSAPRQERFGLRWVADSGQDPSLLVARLNQTQEVLPQAKNFVTLPFFHLQLPPIPISSGLPPGFKLTEEILNAEKPTLPPPVNIHYNEKHVSGT